MKLCQERFGPEHLETVRAESVLGALYCMAQEDGEGAKLLRASVHNAGKISWKDSDYYWSSVIQLARADLRLGVLDEAESLAWAMLAELEKRLVAHGDTAELEIAHEIVAEAASRLGHRDQLEDGLRKFIDRVLARVGADDSALARALALVAATYLGLEDMEQARQYAPCPDDSTQTAAARRSGAGQHFTTARNRDQGARQVRGRRGVPAGMRKNSPQEVGRGPLFDRELSMRPRICLCANRPLSRSRIDLADSHCHRTKGRHAVAGECGTWFSRDVVQRTESLCRGGNRIAAKPAPVAAARGYTLPELRLVAVAACADLHGSRTLSGSRVDVSPVHRGSPRAS